MPTLREPRNASTPSRAQRPNNRPALASTAVCILAAALAWPAAAQPAPKPRVIVTTDPELDDSNSLIRYLLYSDQFRTEGLIYASSAVHWKGDGHTVINAPPGEAVRLHMPNPCPCLSWRWAPGERYIDEGVEAYAKAYPNLKAHSPDYPLPEALKAVIRIGNVEFVGDMSKDSPGSKLIEAALMDSRPGPIFLLAWGGQSTIGRALTAIETRYGERADWPQIKAKIAKKAIIQSFGDQDGAYAAYIKPHWPQIEFRQMSTQTWGYGARGAVQPEDLIYLSPEWTAANVSSRGPMGAHYRVWGDGRQMVKNDPVDYFGFSGLSPDQLKAMGYFIWAPLQAKGSWISEGDTSTFMNLIDNGLQGWRTPDWGGWGGRAGVDVGPKGPDPQYASARCFGAAQRDFAARLAWSTTAAYGKANHAPIIRLAGAAERRVRPGDSIRLSVQASDPDGDALSGGWRQYQEVGTYPKSVKIVPEGRLGALVNIPEDARPGQTLHLILEVSDGGSPSLTRYQRVVLTVGQP
jgi:hypothetical protein